MCSKSLARYLTFFLFLHSKSLKFDVHFILNPEQATFPMLDSYLWLMTANRNIDLDSRFTKFSSSDSVSTYFKNQLLPGQEVSMGFYAPQTRPEGQE